MMFSAPVRLARAACPRMSAAAAISVSVSSPRSHGGAARDWTTPMSGASNHEGCETGGMRSMNRKGVTPITTTA